MIRTSRHILKYQTQKKDNLLDKLFEDYTTDLRFYISLILEGKLPLQKFLSSKILPNNAISHGQWKQIIYKQASEIVRSNIDYADKARLKNYKKIFAKAMKLKRFQWFTNKKFSQLKLKNILYSKYFPKIDIKSVTINLDSRIWDSLLGAKMFNEYLNIRLPYRDPNGKYRNSLTVKIPVKYHKHSLKFVGWKKLKTVKLSKLNNNYYVNFFYEKEEPPKKKSGEILGIDQGYKNLITCSDGNVVGKETRDFYDKLTKKKKNSKSYKRMLIQRNNFINHCINSGFFNQNLKELVIENLKNVKHKSKFNRKVNNKIQHWVYTRVVSKLERFCQENGILLTKVEPAYTSQCCSSCGFINSENRKGSLFKCLRCGIEMDADHNAAINILRLGAYNPQSPKNQKPEVFY